MDSEKSKALHSRYNPRGEAERYVSSLSLSGGIRFFILIEPGLGYIIAPLREKLPGAKIIALHAEKIPGVEAAGKPDAEWSPESAVSLQDFLEAEIPDSNAAEIRLLEWRPALPLFGKAYLVLVEESTEFIKRSDANARTLKAFGKLWLRNFFKNLSFQKNVIRPAPLSSPLLVTGAGPGLEYALPLIREEQKQGRLFIIAASSSVCALESGKVDPDLVIASDGTFWAKFHLYEVFRGKEKNGKPCPLAVSLSAALPSQCERSPLLPISDGSLWQKLILDELGIPFIALPQRGTVSATALDLAFALSRGEVFIAGMDLANSDIRSHARPYSLDRLIEEKAGRMNPGYSQSYKRASMMKAGGSYAIYAAWFRKQLASYPRPIHPLGKNNPLFSVPEAAVPLSPAGEGKPSPGFKIVRCGESAGRPRKALEVLETALRDPAYSSILRKELSALLFPGPESASPEELINTIKADCLPGGRGRD